MTKTGAHCIAETLAGYGVTHVFYVEAILRRALLGMQALGIQRVLAHSEKAAAYMADGYARVSGRPGVCMAQSVGAANLAAALQDPYLGRSPVIAITGRKPPVAQYRNAYQEIVHQPMYAPVTKFDANVDVVEQLPLLLRQAFREATSGTPRPVHLDVQGNLGEITELAEGDLEVIVEETFTQFPAHRPMPDEDSLRRAADALVRAARPVIVAGSGATGEIVELAEALSMPVATSLGGKGIIPENHRLSVGVVGSYSRWCANRTVSEADLVLFVGCHTGDQVTHDWQVPRPGTPVIQIDADAAELGRNYPGTIGVLGDPKATVRRLVECLGPDLDRKEDWAERARDLVAGWRREAEPLCTSDALPMRVERLCRELTRMLPDDAILAADTGYSGIWTGTMVELTHAGQRYIRAAGSLGWAFPASLGAKCAAPERPVVCFTGDGGFYYHMAELETAARCGINTVTVINDNAAFGQCVIPPDPAAGTEGGLVRFRDVDFARIAEEMGCLGIRVERPADIAPALEKALAADRPAVVDVVTDPAPRAPAPWAPAVHPDAGS